MSFVIIEGADGAGKSTLADKIVERYGAVVIHVGPPETDNVFHEYVALASELMKNNQNVVMDRYHLGSFVYGSAFRGGPDMTPREYYVLEDVLSVYGSLLVYARPEYVRMDQSLAERDELDPRGYEAPEKQQQIRNLFDDAYQLSNLQKVQLDPFEDIAVDALYNDIEANLNWKALSWQS